MTLNQFNHYIVDLYTRIFQEGFSAGEQDFYNDIEKSAEDSLVVKADDLTSILVKNGMSYRNVKNVMKELESGSRNTLREFVGLKPNEKFIWEKK